MPKFIQDVLDNLDKDIENLLWINVAFENPDFPENSDEEIRIPDAYIEDNILTM